MLTAEKIKQAALDAGADACGIGPMSRFDGAPDEMNPQFLYPEVSSDLCFAFRAAYNGALRKGRSFTSILPWPMAV